MKLIFLFLAISAFAVPDCPNPKNPLYCTMLELSPRINKTMAFELSNLLHSHLRKEGLDPYRAIAIAMQESGIRRIHRKGKIIRREEICEELEGSLVCEAQNKVILGYTDLSIFQFHVNTIEAYNLDLDLLESHDLEYLVKSYVKIMKKKLRYCKDLGDEAWSCWHSTTEGLRENYVKLVDRYYKGKK